MDLVQDKEAWIGLTDELAEGEWRKPDSLASDEAFDADVDENLFSWASNEPNNNHEGSGGSDSAQNCVYVGRNNQPLEMDDSNCCADDSDTCKLEDSYAGDKYGLCEIPAPTEENN